MRATLLAFCALGAACGNGAPDGASTASPLAGCDAVDASSCQAPTPSYATDIAPLLERDCNMTCHSPGAGPWPLTSYSLVSAWADVIVGSVRDCAMPPADAGALSVPDRSLLLNWFACGAPNN